MGFENKIKLYIHSTRIQVCVEVHEWKGLKLSQQSDQNQRTEPDPKWVLQKPNDTYTNTCIQARIGDWGVKDTRLSPKIGGKPRIRTWPEMGCSSCSAYIHIYTQSSIEQAVGRKERLQSSQKLKIVARWDGMVFYRERREESREFQRDRWGRERKGPAGFCKYSPGAV